MIKITNIKFALLAVFAGLLFTVSAQALNYTVNSTLDNGTGGCTAGECTLREAIVAATGTAAPDTIDFDSTVFSTQQTITVGAQLSITGSATNTLTITGPGAALLTISGGGATRVINISSGVTVQISGVTISDGNCGQGCGINNGGNLTVNNSVISNNGTPTTAGSGVGIFNVNPGSLTMNNSTVTNNQTISGSGVGISSNGGTVNISNSTLSNNNGDPDNTGAAASGGGIGVGGNTALTMTNSIVSGNISGNGNGIFISNTGSVTITDTIINNNISAGSGSGGGIFIANCTQTITIERTTIRDNTSNASGGGINKGAASTCSMVINNSTISGNTSVASGGGINNAGGSLTLTNSTISGNNATDNAATGGGINNVAVSGAVVALTNTTVSNNSVTNPLNAGGFSNSAATSIVTLNDTIIANSTSGAGSNDCINNGTLNASYSLIEQSLACVNGTSSNNLTGDPKLGPLADNGGTTQTHAPLLNSIAIDAGNSGLMNDQRGSNRPINLATYPDAGNGSDIGAVELLLAPTAANVSIGGRVLTPEGRGLRNAVVYLTKADGETVAARTSTFGYYRFNDLEAGQTVVVSVISKRYQFNPQVVSLEDSLTDLDFTAIPGREILR